MIPTTPRGFKDVLPEEARIREELRIKTASTLDLWGYDPIETPTLEIVEVLEEGSSIGSRSFRFFDKDDNLLVMRPDVTLPIARMVASRLGVANPKHRFRYDLRVFRDSESSGGDSREFTQLGIEQIGYSGPAADAETIITFIESLLACGLRDFKIEFCNVSALKGLLAACDLDAESTNKILRAFHTSNYVGLDKALENSTLDAKMSDRLRGLMRVYGDGSAIDKCGELLGDLLDQDILESLAATWKILDDCGYSDFAGIDFSLMSSFDYYTGLIMEAYVPGYGRSIGSGGRYDNLLASFGNAAPAAGFAFSLEDVMHALSAQGSLKSLPRDIESLKGEDSAAFKKAMALHSKGIAAQMSAQSDTQMSARMPAQTSAQADTQMPAQMSAQTSAQANTQMGGAQ